MSRVRADIHRLCDLDVPVLLLGETGTGKDLVARAIHQAGNRRSGPYVPVNVGAIPPSLAASELFGAAKGAYTGASQSRVGYFRQAQGGTLFLDEVGDVPSDVQVHFLRALENKEIQPVGADKPIPVNARIIAATDANLENAVREGKFRAPLHHRLSGYEVRIPPLRERKEDLGELILHFLKEELTAVNKLALISSGGATPWYTPHVASMLMAYHWPGNVRQLRNAIRQIVIHSAEAEFAQLPPSLEASLLAPEGDSQTETSSSAPRTRLALNPSQRGRANPNIVTPAPCATRNSLKR